MGIRTNLGVTEVDTLKVNKSIELVDGASSTGLEVSHVEIETVTPDALVVGNNAGDALEMRDWVTISDNDRTVYANAPNPDPDGYGAGFVVRNSDSNNVAQIYSSDDFSQILITKGAGNTGLDIRASEGQVEVNFKDDLKLTGVDVVASDATATLTVDAVEYEIAKAVKVKIGADTFFIPVFGPVAP